MVEKSRSKCLNRKELAEILHYYDLGDLKESKSLPRRRGSQRIYVVSTSNQKYLLKEYKTFDYSRRKSLLLLNFLSRYNYPSTRVFNSKSGFPYILYKKRYFSIFEFLYFPKRSKMTAKKAYEVGKYLGLLHSIAADFPIKRKNRGYDHFRKMLLTSYYKKKYAPNKVKSVITYIKNNIDSIKAPSNSPKSVCHVEFVRKHLLFKGQKLYRVIDWDFVGRDTMFYDLGTTTTIAFSDNKKFNFNFLANLIKGYDKQRKLTKWEKDHVYEAVLYGAFKYAIWDIPGKAWDRGTFEYARELMTYDKKSFNRELSKYI